LTGKLVFNRTVSLKEDDFKQEISEEEIAAIEARRAEAKRVKEAKEARMQISPEDYFREVPEHQGKYSRYNEKGVPTHSSDGKELTKSAMKKLEKEQLKHSKAVSHYQKKKE